MMNTLVPRVKAKVNHITRRILRWVGTHVHVSDCAITILGIVLAGFLYYHPVPQKAISQFKNLGDIFIAVGGMIGTILALVFSLSIFYALRSDHYVYLNGLIGELAEIAYKAVGRSETHTAELAISAMAK